VSANSVTVNDIQNGGITVPGTSSGGGGSGLSTGAIVGIVIGALAGLLLLGEHLQTPAGGITLESALHSTWLVHVAI
jgi:hypothetical protein